MSFFLSLLGAMLLEASRSRPGLGRVEHWPEASELGEGWEKDYGSLGVPSYTLGAWTIIPQVTGAYWGAPVMGYWIGTGPDGWGRGGADIEREHETLHSAVCEVELAQARMRLQERHPPTVRLLPDEADEG